MSDGRLRDQYGQPTLYGGKKEAEPEVPQDEGDEKPRRDPVTGEARLSFDSPRSAAMWEAAEDRRLEQLRDDLKQAIHEATGMKLTLLAQSGHKMLSTQRAMYAKAGVRPEGTPHQVEADTLAAIARDAMAIQYEGWVAEERLKNQAQTYRLAGDYAKQGGEAAMWGDFLSGAGSLIAAAAAIAAL